MHVACISDTHGFHRLLTVPKADVLICCGDFTMKGEIDVIYDFADWFAEQPVDVKIVIGGNHDLSLDSRHARYSTSAEMAFHRYASQGVHYLMDSQIVVNGYKFYGSPWVPHLPLWAFASRGNPWQRIPPDTDVLVTHGPPLGILDGVTGSVNTCYFGCAELRERVMQLQQNRLKLHVFGHVHARGGQTQLSARPDGPVFVNAAMLGEGVPGIGYDPSTLREPVVVDI